MKPSRCHPRACPFGRTLIATFGLCLAVVAARADDVDARVLVLGSHYLYRGEATSDLNALERAVLERAPRSVGLDACGAVETRSLLAAAQRFRNLEVRLRLLDEDHAACAADLRRSLGTRPDLSGRQALGIDDEVVRKWWATRVP